MKSKNTLFFCLTFFSLPVLAQKSNKKFFPKNKIVFDTLVVYDTLFITDTVKIIKNRPPVSAIEQLPLSNILVQVENWEEKKILILNEDFAATFSKGRILVVDKNNHSFTNQKSTTMKKIGFFGVLFFAFQNMVAAQNNISVGLGGGFYQIATTLSSPNPTYGGSVNKTSPSALYKIGVNGEKAFAKGKFSVVASLNYAFQTKTSYSPTPILAGGSYADGYDKNYHSLSIPLAFRLNIPWIKPLVGVESYFRKTPVEYTTVTDPVTGKSAREGSLTAYFGAGLLAGCDIPLGSRLNTRLTYCKGLTYERKAQYGTSDQLKSRLNKTEIALFYSFSKKKKSVESSK
jgi:hypothetical protein